MINVYTDGGFVRTPNGGVGSWSYIIVKGEGDKAKKIKEFSKSEIENPTNNKMELLAAIEGLKSLSEISDIKEHEVILKSDSLYLVKGLNEWIDKWKSNGWKTRTDGDVKNKDYWVELDKLKSKYKVIVQWVKGHESDKYNIECDANCQKRIKEEFEKQSKESKKK